MKNLKSKTGNVSGDALVESILKVAGPPMGARIKARREEMHMNQNELAAALGVVQSEIAKIEQGARALSMEKAKKLAGILKTTPMYLLSGK